MLFETQGLCSFADISLLLHLLETLILQGLRIDLF